MLIFRKAGLEDMLLYFEWANDDTVRQNAVNKKKIPLEDHAKWFSKKINTDETLMLLCLLDNVGVGQLRIDLHREKKEGIIDYSVDKSARGKGLGTGILREGKKYFFRGHKDFVLIGMVNEKNSSSISAFRKAGYEESPEKIRINNEQYLKFSAHA